MLTEKEEVGIKGILDKLELNDLYSLAFTVTKGFIKPENKQEAVQTVLLYCEKPSLLLRRKKVKKEIIFDYLRDNGIVVPVSGEKRDYIKSCLQFWGSLENNIQFEPFKEPVEDGMHCVDSEYDIPELSRVPAESPFGVFCNLDPSEVVRMGQDFVVWFYKLLKESSLGVTSCGSFGEHLFLPECSFSWLVQDAERLFKGDVGSPGAAAQVVTEMILCNRLVLEPGVEGVLSSYEPHGIVQVKVGGVVYRFNSAVGLFDQVFALFRDPAQNNSWKVKRSTLTMQVNISFAQTLPPT